MFVTVSQKLFKKYVDVLLKMEKNGILGRLRKISVCVILFTKTVKYVGESRGEMASIKEIAKICGVSVATVSKALNDKADISEETKHHIKEVAKQMGYVPQYYARAIRLNRSFNLGVLCVDEAQSGLTHDYFAHILNSFKVTAEAQGYDITFINSDKHNKKKKTYLEHCRYRGLDGVVIACINFDNSEVKELVTSDVPVVTIDHSYTNCTSVVSNNSEGMRDLIEYIISMGHEKIAYISGESSAVTRQRIDSYYETMEKHGIPVLPAYHISAKYRNLNLARECTRQLMDLQDPPTCIIYPDDFSAVGGIGQLREMNKVVGEDISIAGYDDLVIAGQLRPRLATVHQDTEMIGKMAAKSLISLIERGVSNEAERLVVDSYLEKGQSIRCLNGRNQKKNA